MSIIVSRPSHCLYRSVPMSVVSFCPTVCIVLSHCLSVSFCLTVCLYRSVPLSVCIVLSHCLLYRSVSLSVCIVLSHCLSVSFCLTVCLYRSVSLSVSFCLCLYHSISLSVLVVSLTVSDPDRQFWPNLTNITCINAVMGINYSKSSLTTITFSIT